MWTTTYVPLLHALLLFTDAYERKERLLFMYLLICWWFCFSCFTTLHLLLLRLYHPNCPTFYCCWWVDVLIQLWASIIGFDVDCLFWSWCIDYRNHTLPIVMFVGFRFAFVKRFRKKQRIRRGGGEKQKEAAFRTWLNIACWRVMNLDLLEPQVDDIDLNVFTDWFHSYQWSRAPHPSAIQISWVCLRLSGGLWQGIHHGTTWSFHGKNAWEFLHQMGHM